MLPAASVRTKFSSFLPSVLEDRQMPPLGIVLPPPREAQSVTDGQGVRKGQIRWPAKSGFDECGNDRVCEMGREREFRRLQPQQAVVQLRRGFLLRWNQP